MRKKPFEPGDVVRFILPQEASGTILRFYYQRCYSKTEQRVKIQRTHALVQMGDRQVKVPYRGLSAHSANGGAR